MRKIAIALLVALLAGCAGTSSRQSELAFYDLGYFSGGRPASGLPSAVAIATIEVRANSWLVGPEMRYRLASADSSRRHVYAHSRWVAPPAELLERFLQRRLVFDQPESAAPGCRLQLHLDEIEQRFATPQTSKLVLEVGATLLPRRGATVLAKRAFLIQHDAPTPDAQGGVVATREAAQALADELAQWLNELARERPQVINICKEK